MYDDLRLLAEFLEILNKRSTRVSPISNWDRSQHWPRIIVRKRSNWGGSIASSFDDELVHQLDLDFLRLDAISLENVQGCNECVEGRQIA